MKNMLGMLLYLFEMIGQTTNEEVKEGVAIFRDFFQKLTGNDGETWLAEFKKFLRKEACWAATAVQAIAGAVVCYVVDCTKSLDEMIKAGNYDWVDSGITAKRFPIKSTGADEWEFKMFHFDRSISSEDAVAGIKADDSANPWQPAGIEHVLTYGKENPEEQRKYPIVALGSVGGVGGNRYVPYLGGHDSERGLRLRWWDGDWGACCRFLGVRKKVSQTSVS